MKEKITKTKFIGELEIKAPFVVYCNEKENNRTGFLFKCSKDCKHNIIKNNYDTKRFNAQM